MAVLAIDFDNTMFKGSTPLPGVAANIKKLRELGHKIIVHSCNEKNWIERLLKTNEIEVDYINSNSDGKPLADLYIDDKGYKFPYNGDWNKELIPILMRLDGLDNRKWLQGV